MPPRSYIRPVLVDELSPFLGEGCALCKEPFAPGDELIVCPEDGSRHHVHCWEANNNHCTAYGCQGQAEVLPRQAAHGARPAAQQVIEQAAEGQSSKVRTMPTSSMGCAQSCLVFSIALAILLIAFSCYGLWAMLDYVFLEELGWSYRTPNSGMILPLFFTAVTRDLPLFLAL